MAPYRVDEDGDAVGVYVGGDAVAQIEDVAGSVAVAGEHPQSFCPQYFGRGEQSGWIQVALQGDAALDRMPRFCQVRRPIDADGVATDACDFLQPGSATLREHDVGHAASVGL